MTAGKEQERPRAEKDRERMISEGHNVKSTLTWAEFPLVFVLINEKFITSKVIIIWKCAVCSTFLWTDCCFHLRFPIECGFDFPCRMSIPITRIPFRNNMPASFSCCCCKANQSKHFSSSSSPPLTFHTATACVQRDWRCTQQPPRVYL